MYLVKFSFYLFKMIYLLFGASNFMLDKVEFLVN